MGSSLRFCLIFQSETGKGSHKKYKIFDIVQKGSAVVQLSFLLKSSMDMCFFVCFFFWGGAESMILTSLDSFFDSK